MHESEAMAVLVSAQGIGYAGREAALRAAGSARALLQEPGIAAAALGARGVQALRKALQDADRLLERLCDVHLIVRGSEGYPGRLLRTARPPHLLFCMGRAMLDDDAALAVVGTRQPTAYGLRHTHAIAKGLAEAGVCVVSGLALGIDAQAHEGALACGGRTIAVLGSALDQMYPAQNAGLMARIVERGGSVVSEYPPGVGPTRYSFLERNRIIAGLSQGVLVTEGARRSGALSTVHHALDEGREVFALPGDVDRVTAQLPNQLIAEGAQPVACAADVLGALSRLPASLHAEPDKPKHPAGGRLPQRDAAPAAPVPAAQEPPAPSKEEAKILGLLAHEDMDFDRLCEQTGMDSDELGALLVMLELDGRIEALPGERYRHA
ncbi:MAG: DNA-processing protein DprA [Candidatus Ventricola sp.]